MEDIDSSQNVEKLLVDDSSDFMFHAAYLTYSKAWVENLEEEVRLQLNGALLSLIEKKDYSTFYRKIQQYRKNGSPYSERTQFKAKKKRAWRQSEAKKRRISRYKK